MNLDIPLPGKRAFLLSLALFNPVSHFAPTSFPSRLPVALPPPRETLGEDHATIEKGKPTSEFDHEFTA